MRDIRRAEAALDDVERLAEFIAVDSRQYAASFVRRVQDAARSLEVFPERGRKVREFNRSEIRELLVGNYRLIYILSPDATAIVSVLHRSRDLEGLLGSLEM